MDIGVNSLTELYNKLLPVLKTKVNEMKLNGIDYISENDIWDFFKDKWSNANNLTFFDMVSDILNTKDSVYEKLIKNKWKENQESLSE